VSGYSGAKPSGQIFLNAAGMWPSQTSGCAYAAQLELGTNKESLYYLAFDPATTEYAQATVIMPSDWDAGTVTGTFYWTHPATTTDFDVRWLCQGNSYGNDDALDLAWSGAQAVVDTGGTTSDIYITSATSAITIAGTPAANELVQFRVYRDAANLTDTLAVDAYLLGVLITFTRT
jgi:hypothetical protein